MFWFTGGQNISGQKQTFLTLFNEAILPITIPVLLLISSFTSSASPNITLTRSHSTQGSNLLSIRNAKSRKMKQWPPSDILRDNMFSLLCFFQYLSSAALNFNYFFHREEGRGERQKEISGDKDNLESERNDCECLLECSAQCKENMMFLLYIYVIHTRITD